MMGRASSEFGGGGVVFGDEFGDLDLGTILGAAASGVAASAGVDPGTIKAAQDVLSSPIAKAGFNAGLSVAVNAVAKSGSGGAPAAAGAPATPPAAPPTPAEVHADPHVKATKSLLPSAAKAGFDAGVSLAAGHAAGAAVPGLPPAAQAANLIAAGTPKTSWLRVGLATVGAAGGAFLLGASLPVTIIAGIVGPTALHAFGKDKST